MRPSTTSTSLLAVSGAFAAAYGIVSAVVARGATTRVDLEARDGVQERVDESAKQASDVTGHIGKWYVVIPFTAAVGAVLLSRGRPRGALALVVTSLASTALGEVLDRAMRHRTPPPGKPDRTQQSYPSGHALQTTSVALATAWVCAREGLVPAALAAPLAVVASVVSGAGRLVLDRHWVTDSLGGYCAGLSLGTLASGLYERAR